MVLTVIFLIKNNNWRWYFQMYQISVKIICIKICGKFVTFPMWPVFQSLISSHELREKKLLKTFREKLNLSIMKTPLKPFITFRNFGNSIFINLHYNYILCTILKNEEEKMSLESLNKFSYLLTYSKY